MKKSLVMILGILVVVILSVSGMYLVDRNRMKNNEAVIFGTWGETNTLLSKSGDNNTVQNFEKNEEFKQEVICHQKDAVLSLTLPNDWKYEMLSQSGENYEYGIKFYPIGSENSATLYYYTNGFGICGTGLKIEKMLLNSGIEVNVDYYDGSQNWTFVYLGNLDSKLAVVNQGLTDLEAETALEILKTFRYLKADEMVNLESSSSFKGTILEANRASLLVEPNEGEEIKKSADKIVVSIGEYSDGLYQVGSVVEVTYTGEIMETYPAQIKATKIEVLGFDLEEKEEPFALIWEANRDRTEKELLWAGNEYNVYVWQGNIKIKMGDETYSLKEALVQNKMTMEDIIRKADEDIAKNEEIYSSTLEYQSIPQLMPYQISYDDGGTTEYHYENYTIIKCHTLDGNRDVYIGNSEMKLKDLEL